MPLTCSPLRPHLPYYHRLGQTHGVWDELECGYLSPCTIARPSLTLPYFMQCERCVSYTKAR